MIPTSCGLIQTILSKIGLSFMVMYANPYHPMRLSLESAECSPPDASPAGMSHSSLHSRLWSPILSYSDRELDRRESLVASVGGLDGPGNRSGTPHSLPENSTSSKPSYLGVWYPSKSSSMSQLRWQTSHEATRPYTTETSIRSSNERTHRTKS